VSGLGLDLGFEILVLVLALSMSGLSLDPGLGFEALTFNTLALT